MPFSELVCRICLSNYDTMRHNIEDLELQELYKKLTDSKLNPDSRLPNTICSICYSLLKRIQKFSDLACRSEIILMDLLISSTDKITSNTCSGLNFQIITLSAVPAQTISICNDYTECGNIMPLPNSNRLVNFIDINNPVTVKVEQSIKDEDDVKAEITDSEHSDNDHSSIKSDKNINPFYCDICSKTFATVHLLKSHLISHSAAKPHICGKCNKAFSRKHNMVQHMKTCNVKEQVKCKEQDTELYYHCEICNKKFSSKALLKSHRIIHSGEKPYSCEGCNKAFARKQGMKQHMLICSEVKHQVITFPCPYCTETFDCESDLNTHLSTHPKDKPYTCDKCHKSYTTKQNLKQHLKICFLENALVTCSLCPQTFNCRSDLCKHLNTDHASQKPFCCDRCSAKFWCKSHLKVHMRIHTGERPYACEVCGKTFTLQNHLKAHLGSHSGLKPHACELCGKAFLARFNLREHMRRHTGERPYACSACGKRFGYQSTMRQHLRRVHAQAKPFACDKCPLSFALESGLASHARVHTAARPYACSLCDKTFIEARHLKGHMQVHSEERPHACGACGNAYKRPEHLKLHIKSKCKAGFALSTSSCLSFDTK